MKLIAEIETTDCSELLQICCDGESLTIVIDPDSQMERTSARVPLAEFRKALDAVAGSVQPTAPRSLREVLGRPLEDLTAPPPEPTRNPDGSRRGPSPRFGMRAQPAPEANVIEPEDTAA